MRCGYLGDVLDMIQFSMEWKYQQFDFYSCLPVKMVADIWLIVARGLDPEVEPSGLELSCAVIETSDSV